jgi:signal transduction histidine kinase
MTLDLLWMLLPALIVVTAGIEDPEKRSAPLLLMAVAPILVVNATRLDNISTGGGGTGGDWVQLLHPVPFLVHAFALSLASRRWDRLGRSRRAAFLLMTMLTVAPVALAASHYSLLFLRNPENGHEFVDNRPLAQALAVIPTTGTIVVTNDLRYPAQNFTRDDRQMQIPALFGHQAYAVNYAHEAVEERRPLQRLLQQPAWSDAILDAARAHGWTHLLIRKDYVHPVPVPLERIFDNQFYEVYRFPQGRVSPE